MKEFSQSDVVVPGGTSMKTRSCAGWPMRLLAGSLVWLVPAVARAAESEGKLVHVADTRHLTGFNLFVANLYNTDRLMFTILAVGLTVTLGFTLGWLMDAIVASIGLDLEKRQARE
jgi:hypothetical protein